MVDFINEVEEELRKDKYNALLRKYGPYIVGLIFAIVAVAGFMEFKKYKFDQVARQASASYVSAQQMLDVGNTQGALDRFIALSKVAPEGYAGLSLSRAAGIKVDMKDFDGAISLFDQAAAKFSKPVHKDLASLKSCYILLDLGRFDDVSARIASLTNEDAPYWELAQELEAHAALGLGDKDAATAIFSYLSTAPGVLQGVQTRAQQAMALLRVEQDVPAPSSEDIIQEMPAPETLLPKELSPENPKKSENKEN